MADRILIQEQASYLMPDTFTSTSATCDVDAVLIAGSCNVQTLTNGQDRYVSLASEGIDMDGGWQCSWNNPTAEMLAASARVVCLRFPAGTLPVASGIVRVERTVEIPANNVYIDNVTCDAGDYLLSGSCALDNPDLSVRDVTMFRSGFADPTQNRSNSWQCGWNNPSALTPSATLTAICLTAPSM